MRYPIRKYQFFRRSTPVGIKEGVLDKKIWSTSPSFGFFNSKPINFLESRGYRVDLFPQNKKLSNAEALSLITDCDAVVSGLFPITRELITAAPRLKVIAMHGVGVNHIDVAAASEKKIAVTNTPGLNRHAAAELAIGLYLSLARRIPSTHQKVKEGQWPLVLGTQIMDKTLGIVGLGMVGKTVAQRAMAMGMKVVAYDIMPDQTFADETGTRFLPLLRVMAEADFVSIHVPLMPTTTGLIGEKELTAMQPKAYLVNLSRGKIVNEQVLYRMLADRRIAGAALDVFEIEPPVGNPLLDLDQVIVTSHMGGYTMEAMSAVGMTCAQSIADVLEGKRPEFCVNSEIF